MDFHHGRLADRGVTLLRSEFCSNLLLSEGSGTETGCGVGMQDDVIGGERRQVLIADRHPVFRLGLVALLTSAHPDWEVLETGTLDEHRTRLAQGSIDLLIVDSHLLGLELDRGLPIRGGLNLWVDIIAVTDPGDAMGAFGCLGAGAHATVSRADSASRTLATIEILSIRQQNSMKRAGTERGSADANDAETADYKENLNLTPRQFDVLRLLAKGQSNKVIARDLGLSVSTVKAHLNTVFKALGARNRLEAVVRARPFQARMTQSGL